MHQHGHNYYDQKKGTQQLCDFTSGPPGNEFGKMICDCAHGFNAGLLSPAGAERHATNPDNKQDIPQLVFPNYSNDDQPEIITASTYESRVKAFETCVDNNMPNTNFGDVAAWAKHQCGLHYNSYKNLPSSNPVKQPTGTDMCAKHDDFCIFKAVQNAKSYNWMSQVCPAYE